MRKGLVAGACLSLVALSGCWLQPGFGPERQNFNRDERTLSPVNVGGLTQVWSAPMDAGVGGQPLVDGRAVYTSGSVTNGNQATFIVTATARGTGAPLWRRELPTSTFPAFPRVISVADDKVLLFRTVLDAQGAGTFHFEELDAQTGATLRTSRATDEIPIADTVAVSGDALAESAGLVGGAFGQGVVVRSRATLETVWSAQLSAGLGTNIGPVQIAGDRLLTPDVSPSGAVLRTFALAGCGAATCSPTSTVPLPPAPGGAAAVYRIMAAMDDGRVLVRRSWNDATHHDDLLALNPDGSVSFAHQLTSVLGLAVNGDSIFVVGADASTPAGGRSVLAVAGPNLAWRDDVASSLVGPPVLGGDLGGVLFVGDSRADGVDVRAYEANGCGPVPTCAPVTVIDNGPGTGAAFGMSLTFGTVFVSQPAPGNRLIAYRLPPSG
jgi:hypothetical protein